ncbi:arginine exporter protein ArgO [Prauserella shujinwangii]|uniref:Arginine exporter protein ArgO n=1 Tax=Prauserella shujinwangii TaxID=1453103 RepID=A0A2T0LQB2_9PSEU|nr:LysE family transporter [Prauserella shujinwangii]PRX45511.1 arginine exporter protein ArgO [Prauserella shujinwangii]
MSAALVAGLVAGYGIAIPVGAVGAYLVSLSARTSPRIGASAALGVATADGLYALVAALGGAALAGAVAPFAGTLRWASAAALVALAATGALRAFRRHRTRTEQDGGALPDRMSPVRAYTALLGITALNPATVVYFAALVAGHRAIVADGAAAAVVFALAAFVASASWQLLLACGGTLLGRVLSGPRGRLATALASSAVVTALAVHLVVGA